jgi:hypothetical protein
MAPHSIPSICLGPTGNLQGSYYFFSLVTGKIIKRRHWDELPVPQSAIGCVAYYANKSGSPPNLIFSDRHHEPYDWPDDIIIGSNEQQPAPYPDLPDNIPGVQILHKGNVPLPPLFSPSDDQDWTQMADEALTNADIDDMDVLPPPPEVIVIDDDDDILSLLLSNNLLIISQYLNLTVLHPSLQYQHLLPHNVTPLAYVISHPISMIIISLLW